MCIIYSTQKIQLRWTYFGRGGGGGGRVGGGGRYLFLFKTSFQEILVSDMKVLFIELPRSRHCYTKLPTTMKPILNTTI